MSIKHCAGCSHPTICKTHGCGAVEAKRNKSAFYIEKKCRKAFLNEDGYGDPDKSPDRYRVFRDGFYAAYMQKE